MFRNKNGSLGITSAGSAARASTDCHSGHSSASNMMEDIKVEGMNSCDRLQHSATKGKEDL